MKLRALVVASFLVLAGCGGGGGGAVPQPAPVATNSPTGGYLNTASLKLVIPLAAKPSSTKRNPQYVSPSTTTLQVTVNSVNGLSGASIPSWVTPNPQTVVLTTGGASPNCTVTGGGSTWTCTVNTIPAPPGTVNYTFTTTDGTNALATFTGNETITQGISNNLSITMLGIVKTVVISTAALTANAPPSGNSQAVSVTAQDADGNTVTGTYNNPFTLTDGDTTGVTSLAVNGTTGSPVTISNDTDASNVTLAYNGQAVNPFAITAGGTGISGSVNVTATVNDVTFTAGTNDDTSSNGGMSTDPNWGAQTVFFSAISGTATVTASELGWTNASYSKTFNIDASNCAGKASVAPGSSANTFVVTPQAVGICYVKLNESGTGYPLTNHAADATGSETHDGKFWVSITTGSFSVN
jgi:hypothetical protein